MCRRLQAAEGGSGRDERRADSAPVDLQNIESAARSASIHKVDRDIVNLLEVGADVIENPVETPAQAIGDISDITMAEVGSDVLDQPTEVIPQKIDDISGITMAEPGADIIENPKPKEKADIPDTSELSLD